MSILPVKFPIGVKANVAGLSLAGGNAVATSDTHEIAVNIGGTIYYFGAGSGNTLLNGAGVPSDTTDGVDGDFYIDTAAWDIYGPKTGGVWGSGVSIIGPAGADGATGMTGAGGAPGADGAAGATGADGATGAAGAGETVTDRQSSGGWAPLSRDGGMAIYTIGTGETLLTTDITGNTTALLTDGQTLILPDWTADNSHDGHKVHLRTIGSRLVTIQADNSYGITPSIGEVGKTILTSDDTDVAQAVDLEWYSQMSMRWVITGGMGNWTTS